MPRDVFTPKTIGPELRRLAKSFERAVMRGLRRAAEDGMARAKLNIKSVQPFIPHDTGELARSYTVQPISGGYVLENASEHSAVMDQGARPHWAPFAPLLAWAERKSRGMHVTWVAAKRHPHRLKKGASGPRFSPRQQLRDKVIEAFAKGVQRKIAWRGLKGRFFHTDAMQHASQDVQDAVMAELAKVTRELRGRHARSNPERLEGLLDDRAHDRDRAGPGPVALTLAAVTGDPRMTQSQRHAVDTTGGRAVWDYGCNEADVEVTFRCASKAQAEAFREEFRAQFLLDASASDRNDEPNLHLPATFCGVYANEVVLRLKPETLLRGARAARPHQLLGALASSWSLLVREPATTRPGP
jgi:hypothetical protein